MNGLSRWAADDGALVVMYLASVVTCTLSFPGPAVVIIMIILLLSSTCNTSNNM